MKQSKTIPADITKGAMLSVTPPVKRVAYSAKVTGSIKLRCQALISAGFTAEDILRIGCEIHEQWLKQQSDKLQSGEMKKEFKNLTRVK